MTYDPYRANPPQNDPYANPYRDNDPTLKTDSAGTLLLGALLLFAVAGFVYFYGTGDRDTMLSSDLRPQISQPNNPVRAAPPQTTGAGSAE